MGSIKTPQLWIKKFSDNSIVSVDSTVSAYAVAKLIENSKTGAVIVLENQVPVGIVTNRDLAVKIIAHSYPFDTPIRRIMSTPLVSINPETEISFASEIMTSKKIRKLPVIRDDKIMGIFIAADVSKVIPNSS
ncbi:MAG TPA: CBS domain-containing protein [Nitrosopumilaceae archaeon]|nr:CBS domain-containing protein [Nitrosopumilaceae archaeon]